MQVDIDWDTLDSITVKSLEAHYKLNKEILDDYYYGDKWLHRDDLEETSVLIHHLKAVIDYYGGSVG